MIIVVIVMVMFTVLMSSVISVFVRVIMLLIVRMIMVVRVTFFSVRALLAVDVASLGIVIMTITVVMFSIYCVSFRHLVP
jgi:hypothetical protein